MWGKAVSERERERESSMFKLRSKGEGELHVVEFSSGVWSAESAWLQSGSWEAMLRNLF
jgi:hypothetical protein